MMKGQVPAAITEQGLLAKSRVYIQRAFRAKQANDLDEYQLWASLALELLGKAVLASIHPSLVVDLMNPLIFRSPHKCQQTRGFRAA
jgi:hypothetical protein